MRLWEIAILVVLVIAAVAVLATSINSGGSSSSDGTAAAVVMTDTSPDAAADSAEAGDEMTGEDAPAGDELAAAEGEEAEEQTGTYVDLSGSGEYEIAGFSLDCSEGSLAVRDDAGDELVRFRLNSSGNLEPASSQPSGVRVANAWAGPPVEMASKYHVYRKQTDGEQEEIPLMSFYFDSGYVEIIPGDEMERKNATSYRGITRTWRWE